MYKTIGVAVAFSPRCEAIISEAARLQNLFNAKLVLIHIGEVKQDEKAFLDEIIATTKVNTQKLKIIWENGSPTEKILEICTRESIDLLIAGALQKESIVKFYLGSIARKLIRKADCAILMLVNPSNPPERFRHIVINGSEADDYADTISQGIELGRVEKAQQIHIFKSIQLFGLNMTLLAEEENEQDQSETRREIVGSEIQEIEQLLEKLDTGGLKINVKASSGKTGYELQKFTRKVKADLLVVKRPGHHLNILDRIFPHYLEQVMEDLPSNLLIVK